MSSEALKPCPFCGGEAAVRRGDEIAVIQCTQVKMHRLVVDGDNNAEVEAIAAWNRRPREDRLEDSRAAAEEAELEQIEERDALSARLAEAEAIIQDSLWDLDGPTDHHCGACDRPTRDGHAADCVATRARAFLSRTADETPKVTEDR